MKTKAKKKEILEKKKKENKKFLRFVKTNQKYEKFQKAILNGKGPKLNHSNKKATQKIKIKSKESVPIHVKSFDNIIEPNTFSKAYDFIFDKVVNDHVKNLLYDTHMLYCNLDLSTSYNIGKAYNFPINLIHSYYMDVIILVSDESEKWRNMVIENKIKRVKKVITYDKFEGVYYKDDMLNEQISKYDLFIFDATIRTKKYAHIISRIKKNNKTFTTLQLDEDTFADSIDKVIRRTYTDLNKGSTHSVPIGYLSLGKDKLFDNIREATKGMLQFYEQKKMSVVSINLRYVNMTIPVYIHVLKDGVASDY
ncbi:ribosomal protein L1, putative [Plasmodium vivax]|uniref:Ribosomal protein L1, putative n=1 Tax=Plasmodium vivax TaxID=5855 RepID=A0A564ZX05_PLAVI|nr:ribosomal protein L1, putative [Plasmodium vivax]